MTKPHPPRARVTMLIEASAKDVYDAFIEPEILSRFWLSRSSGPLRVGEAVVWDFMVDGASAQTIATRLHTHSHIEWQWPDGAVEIKFEPFDTGTAVTLINSGFQGDHPEQVEQALNATEGFAIVLSDLKTLLETGRSAGLTKAKAQLIQARG
jgi:uncharacterized protein YndB with AHSA1/START domain